MIPGTEYDLSVHDNSNGEDYGSYLVVVTSTSICEEVSGTYSTQRANRGNVYSLRISNIK